MVDQVNLHVSKVIQSKRIAAGLSLLDVSEQTGIEVARLSAYEVDSTGMSTEELKLVALALNVEFSEFFEGYNLPGATRATG